MAAPASLPRATLKWVLSLDLSYPVKNIRRDFANGFLFAEILSRYYPADVQMHSFENVASSTRKKQNWHLISKLLQRKHIAIEPQQVECIMAADGDAAVELLQTLHTFIHGPGFEATQAPSAQFSHDRLEVLSQPRDHCLSASNSYADDQGSAHSEAQPAGGGGWSGPGFGAPRPQGMPQQATLFIPMGAQQPLGMQPMGYAGAGFPGTVGYGMQQPMQQGMRPMQPMQPMHGGVLYPPLPPGPPAYQQMSPGLPLGAQGSGAKPGAARFSSPGRALLQQQQQGAPGYGAGEGMQGQGAGAPRAPPGQGGPDRFQSPGRPPVPQWGGVAGGPNARPGSDMSQLSYQSVDPSPPGYGVYAQQGGYAQQNGGYAQQAGGYAQQNGGYGGQAAGHAQQKGGHAQQNGGGKPAAAPVQGQGKGPRPLLGNGALQGQSNAVSAYAQQAEQARKQQEQLAAMQAQLSDEYQCDSIGYGENDAVPTNKDGLDNIPFAKARPVDNFQPYDIKDFQEKDYNVKRAGGAYWELGRLGPNLESEELQAKREKAEKIKLLAAEVREENLKRAAVAAVRPRKEPAPKEPTARERATQFAKGIPKPEPGPLAPPPPPPKRGPGGGGGGGTNKQSSTVAGAGAERGLGTGAAERGPGAGGTPLQMLEARHAEDRKKVEAIRAELNRML